MSVARLRALILAFFAWWLAELGAMAQPLRRALKQRTKTLTLQAGDEGWVLGLRRGTRFQELARIDPDLDARAARKAVSRHLKKANASDFALLLPESGILRRSMDMPAIAEQDLRQAIYFDIDRQTPFRSSDVYFDYRVVKRRPDGKRLTVELLTVPRPAVDAILRRAAEWGLHPSAIDIATEDRRSGIGVNLLAGAEFDRRYRPLADV